MSNSRIKPTHYKRVIIRYNTKSKNAHNCWRVILDHKEILVNSVKMNGYVMTSHDMMPNSDGTGHELKGHVCMENVSCIIDKHTAFLTSLPENRIQVSVIKTITYRIFASFLSFLIGYFITGNFQIGLSIGLADLLLKSLIYFCHEIIWQKTIKK